MPNKPPKPCAHTGCPELTHNRYCEVHTKAEAQRYEKYDRDPATRKRYGTEWRKIRAAFLSAYPLCEVCSADGKLVPAELVHHKRKLSDGGSHDWNNLQSLCQECHSRLHAKQGDRF